jgi:hypothetical protein
MGFIMKETTTMPYFPLNGSAQYPACCHRCKISQLYNIIFLLNLLCISFLKIRFKSKHKIVAMGHMQS